MRRTNILFPLVTTVTVAGLLLVPVFIKTQTMTLRLDTDYDINIPLYSFLIDSIRSGKGIPSINPYASTGIPTFGDPTSFLYNPIMMLPLILFRFEVGMKVNFFVLSILSFFSMWVLLQSLHIKKTVRLWGAILYQTSGAYGAIIASGHTEHLFSYSIVPLFFAIRLNAAMNIKRSMFMGFLLSAMLLSGDIYRVFHLTIMYLVVFLVRLSTHNVSLRLEVTYGIITYGTFLLLSLVKIVPYLVTVYPNLVRFYPVNPFAGSIHAWFVPFSFLIQSQTLFYDRPGFRRLFGFYFNWHEYYAFLSPIPFFYLIAIKHVWKKDVVRMVALLLVTGALYVAIRFPYSPFYFVRLIFPFFSEFRAPQRMVVVMTSLVIVMLCFCIDAWYEKSISVFQKTLTRVMLGIALVWTGTVFSQTVYSAYEKPRAEQARVAHELKARDPSSYYVVSLVCCMQTFLMRERIAMLNYYYGWRPRQTPDFLLTESGGVNMNMFASVRPKYILSAPQEDFIRFGYMQFLQVDNTVVWKTDKPTVVPAL